MNGTTLPTVDVHLDVAITALHQQVEPNSIEGIALGQIIAAVRLLARDVQRKVDGNRTSVAGSCAARAVAPDVRDARAAEEVIALIIREVDDDPRWRNMSPDEIRMLAYRIRETLDIPGAVPSYGQTGGFA